MNKDVSDAMVRAIVAQCQCGGDCDCWIRNYIRREDARRREFPGLRLVHDDRKGRGGAFDDAAVERAAALLLEKWGPEGAAGRKQQRERDAGMKPHEVEMRDLARTIRAFREDDNYLDGCAKPRPKLTLVYSRD